MASAPLSFAGLHELPELLEPGLYAGGFIALLELLKTGVETSGFIFQAILTHYLVSFVCLLHGPVFVRVCCAAKDPRTGARTPMKPWVRRPWCAATAFALQTYNRSGFGEIIADLCSRKADLGKLGSACYALHQFAPSAHTYPTAMSPPERFQVLVHATFLAETVVVIIISRHVRSTQGEKDNFVHRCQMLCLSSD